MATIKAFIRVSTKKVANVNIRFRLSDGRAKQLFHKSEISISSDLWDEKNQTVKARAVYDMEKRTNFNNAVSARKELIMDLFNAATNKEGLTSDWLDEAIDMVLHPQKYIVAVEPDQPETLLSYIAYFIEKAPTRKDKTTGRLLNANSMQQYKATEKHVKAFAKMECVTDYQFNEIDGNFYNRFVEYLQNPIVEKGKDGKETIIKESFTQNSVGKHIKVLKLMIKEAGVTEANITNFHVFTEDVDTVYLNETELQLLKDFDYSDSPHLDRVCDWFLLLCWTGCRFSDLEKISKTDIKDGFITFRQQKTNTKVTIPLHPVVLDLLKKYDYSMPEPITNQRFNEYIKVVVQLAGIDAKETFTRTVGGKLVNETKPKHDLVTSHTGRRSFCTNMYKRGLPTLMIMSISGHRTEKSFLKYIKVKQDEHAKMMAEKWSEMYKINEN